MSEKIRIPISLYPSQEKFIFSTKKQTIYVGGRGSGKTACLLIKAIQEATRPNNEVLLVRKTYNELKTFTLPMLFERPGDLPTLLPQDSKGQRFDHNQAEHAIRFNNGGVLRYVSMDDPLKIYGATVGSVFIDELVEFDESEYLKFLEILRGPHGNQQIYACTNPTVISSWMYKRFVLNRDDKLVEYINAPSSENHRLSASYIDTIKSTHTEEEYERVMGGKWGSTEGCIYKEFDRERHVKTYEYNQFKEFFISMDYGFADPNAFLLIGVNGNKYHIFQELQRNNMMHDDIIEYLDSLKTYTTSVICDPSAAGVIAYVESKGFRCYQGMNKVETGINEVKNVLDKNRLTIDPSCVNLISALENYKFDDKGKPIHKGSHMPDSLRYGIMHQLSEPTTHTEVLNI